MTTYRADVDGLRALAVIPVLMFHARYEAFSGGFVGVDVFFVISGFLITSIIAREAAAGCFSIVSFYERRARRILPALLTVIAFSAVTASLLFLPEELKDFGASTASAMLFSSNILFWREAGYFDAPAELKPLLHTWSLAVEEQFYVVFPLVLVAAHRWLRAKWGTVVLPLLAISFAASVYGVAQSPVATFYLAPTRAWELLLGAMLALRPLPPGRPLVREVAAFAGIAAILVAVFTYSSQTPFPGAHALLPCLGTALVIWAGMHGPTLAGTALSWRPVVFVGLISYSLYLWHWPLLVFARYWNPDISGPEAAAVLAASAALAAVSWRFIELPVRSRRLLGPRGVLFNSAAAASVLVAVIGYALHRSEGWPERIDDDIRAMAALENRMHGRRDCHVAAAKTDAQLCVRGAPAGKVNFMLVGDSHADALNPTIFDVARERGLSGIQFTDPGFRPTKGYWRAETAQRDRELVARLGKLITQHQPQLVIIAAFWRDALEKIYYDDSGQVSPETAISSGLTALIEQHPKTRFVLLHDVPVSAGFAPGMLARAKHLGRPIEQTIPVSEYHRQTKRYDHLLRALDAAHGNLDVVDVSEYFCDRERCYGVIGGEPIYRNEDHLSPAGARLLAPLYHKLFVGVGDARGVEERT